MKYQSSPSKHTFATRLVHVGLAVAVISQLVTSLVLEPIEPGSAGNVYFTLHEYVGLAAFVFVLGFWGVATLRRKGTAWGLLLPWLSGARLSALWADIRVHIRALAALRMPEYQAHSPLASAVHGLGLLLMTAMATTGTVYYFVNSGDPDADGLVGVVMFVHTSLANLVWAYLIGHASLALIHHFFQSLDLREMWSLRRMAASTEPAERSS